MYSRTANSAIAWMDLIRKVVVFDSVLGAVDNFFPTKKANRPMILAAWLRNRRVRAYKITSEQPGSVLIWRCLSQ